MTMTDMLAPERRNSADPTPPKTWVEKFNIDDGERVTFYEESSDLTVSLRRGGALEGSLTSEVLSSCRSALLAHRTAGSSSTDDRPTSSRGPSTT